jgi:hypothetical protein
MGASLHLVFSSTLEPPGALPSWFPEVLAYFRIDRRMDSLSHQLLDELARIYARAAVEALMLECRMSSHKEPASDTNRKASGQHQPRGALLSR